MKFIIITKKHIAAVCTAALGAALAAAVFLPGSVPVYNVKGREIPIYSVERADRYAALTFDCAWNDEDVSEILDILDKHGIKACFFMVGTWAEKYPESVRAIYQRGHEIGNHSYNHADYTKLSAEQILADLEKCDTAIESITGEKPFFVRAPSGGYNDTVVKTIEESGRMYIQWSVDSLDYKAGNIEEIITRCDKTKPGDILLMHNGTEYTAKALDTVITHISNTAELMPLADLVYTDGYTVDHSGRQFKK